jgi:hypothetical protein
MEKITINDEVIGNLTDHAFINLSRNLTRYGNNLSKAHYTALWKLLDTYTRIAHGQIRGRFAFPLGTGMGKTQSIVSWLMAIYDCPPSEPVSVAVCASKVEALCKIKLDLIKQGVPEDKIGLLHSYKFDPQGVMDGKKECASLPSTTDHDQKPILLATHNRVKGKGGTGIYNLYQGKPRSLLIWDETLLKSQSYFVRQVDLMSGIGYLKPRHRPESTAREALEYLEECSNTFKRELEAQGKTHSEPQVLTLPSLTPKQIDDYRKSLGGSPVVEPLKALLDMSQEPIRAALTQQNDGVIRYDIVVPEELENIVILDASHTIRELAHLDQSIQKVDIEEDMVSYREVTIHQLRSASGRHSMAKAFTAKKKDRKVCQEVAQVIQEIPQEEGILVFTFKKRDYRGEVDFRKVLQDDLEGLGIDLEATVQDTHGQDKPRFAWLTWGNETSLSEFNYCSNVIFAGVLHRDHLDLMADIAGQMEDLTVEITNDKVQEVSRSEIAHCLYQGMCRGACRVIRGDATLLMNVWLIHKDTEIQELIQKVMPGVNWKPWTPQFMTAIGKSEVIGSKIQEYLKTLPEGVSRMSTSSIKQVLGLKDVPKQTFTLSLEIFKNGGADGWTLEGRSLVRVMAVETFFPPDSEPDIPDTEPDRLAVLRACRNQ